jgi:hypothetical protein
MFSVNLDGLISGEYETLGGHSGWPSDYLHQQTVFESLEASRSI